MATPPATLPAASATAPDSPAKPRIALGADHAGFHLKETLKTMLQQEGYPCEDLGTTGEEPVDYPEFAAAVGERVALGQCDLGVLVCGTGIGMSIAANKVEGVRAAVAHSIETARLSRQHNNANVITMGGRLLADAEASAMLREFLAAKFAGGHHQRRIDEITELDEERIR
jgi:ribose 5-phosphate isomerase B